MRFDRVAETETWMQLAHIVKILSDNSVNSTLALARTKRTIVKIARGSWWYGESFRGAPKLLMAYYFQDHSKSGLACVEPRIDQPLVYAACI